MPFMKWDLEDKTKCDGCDFNELHFTSINGSKNKTGHWCYIFGVETTEKRPEICIEKLGE